MNELKVLILNDFASVGATMSKIISNVELCYFYRHDKSLEKIKNSKHLKSTHLMDQIKEFDQLKKNYDIVICFGFEAAKICYLCDIDYIMYINDYFIDPKYRFYLKDSKIKKIKKIFLNKLYSDILLGANMIVSGHKDYTAKLKKYRKDQIVEIINPLNYDMFFVNGLKTNLEKEKFTFLSPTRIDSDKGIELLWSAVEKTSTDFEVLQVDWYGVQSFYKKILKHLPKKIKLVDKIDHNKIATYYRSCDAVLGSIVKEYAGMTEKEAIACGAPVFHYDEIGYTDNDPFYKGSKDPNEIAQYIDRIVIDDKFRKDLQETQLAWLHKTIDNQKIVQQWETTLKDAVTRKRKKANTIYLTIFKLISLLRSSSPNHSDV